VSTATAIEPTTVSRYSTGERVLTTFANYIVQGTIAAVHHDPEHGWIYNLGQVAPKGRDFKGIREKHLFPESAIKDVAARIVAHYREHGMPSPIQRRYTHMNYFRSSYPHQFTAQN